MKSLLAPLLPLAALCLAAPAALAQAPKVGDYYEDSVDIGFRIKTPKDWDFTPPQPGEPNLIGKYTPPFVKYINVSPDTVLWLEVHLVKFDRRKPSAEDEAVTTDEDGNVEVDLSKLRRTGAQDISEYIDTYVGPVGGSGARKVKEKDLRISKVPATEYYFKAQVRDGTEFNIYAVVYHLSEDLDVAFIGNGPDDRKKWRKYESPYKKMTKSFQRLEVEDIGTVAAKEGDSAYRAQKRADLTRECAKNPDWTLYETENYFIISNTDDRQFLDELMMRLEAIREVYEELYPPEQAERLKKEHAETETGEGSGDSGEDSGPSVRTVSRKASPRELSRCSVVRVCSNQNQYHEYGGPGGSAGYWSSMHEELVIYDDKAGGGRRDTWAVLNHEAFHQYIYYFYGNIAPHSWYNEGHGDFFSGYQLKAGRFRLRPFDWRVSVIKEAIRTNKYVPLKDLVRMTQSEYYGNNKFGAGAGQNYAEGWSLVYFLRTGPKKAKNWNDDWNGILDRYLEVLAATGDLDKAVDEAFAGVDWQEFEECWKQYILDV